MRTRRELLKYCTAAAGALAGIGIGSTARAKQTSMSTMKNSLIDALRSTDNEVCLAAANELLTSNSAMPEIALHLRNAGLDVSDALILSNALSIPSHQNDLRIRSFSVSYNPLLGDSGTVSLAKSLPDDVSEIGFVGCEVGDEGGEALLEWAINSTRLTMICVEQNSFSSDIKAKFRQLEQGRPGLLTVV